jgi:hypothetical protein
MSGRKAEPLSTAQAEALIDELIWECRVGLSDAECDALAGAAEWQIDAERVRARFTAARRNEVQNE